MTALSIRIASTPPIGAFDLDPSGARVGAILQAVIAREPVEHRPTNPRVSTCRLLTSSGSDRVGKAVNRGATGTGARIGGDFAPAV